jgi:hypothetical protein
METYFWQQANSITQGNIIINTSSILIIIIILSLGSRIGAENINEEIDQCYESYEGVIEDHIEVYLLLSL